MAEPNERQKVALLDIEPNTIELIEAKLLDGYLIQHMINLQPKYDKLLVIYALNELPPIPPE